MMRRSAGSDAPIRIESERRRGRERMSDTADQDVQCADNFKRPFAQRRDRFPEFASLDRGCELCRHQDFLLGNVEDRVETLRLDWGVAARDKGNHETRIQLAKKVRL